MTIAIGLTNGLVIGVEHLSDAEDEELAYMIVLHLTVFKIMFFRHR
jgi:hypothetical protein